MRDDEIKLRSGKKIYANRLILGISLAEDEMEAPLFEGYDGDIWLTDYNSEINDYEPAFTKEELFELADIAIARWNKFKEAVNNNFYPTIDGKEG